MRHDEFEIGGFFWTGAGKWLCTDIGTRTIVAIRHEEKRAASERKLVGPPYHLAGPPFYVPETIFDEYDIGGCYRTKEEME